MNVLQTFRYHLSLGTDEATVSAFLRSSVLLIHRQARMPVPTGSPGGTRRAEARGNKLSGVELV